MKNPRHHYTGTAAAVATGGEPEGGWPRDKFSGMPGCYVRDPVTGIRTPADDTARQVAAEIEAQELAAQDAAAGATVSQPQAEGQ
ncbi:MAG TPA: hypothetical protein VD932_08635 [Aquabacterium sp.]|nr:hypothetical protein [Aquabacterium sp.]